MINDAERRKAAQKLRELEIGLIGTVVPTGELVKNILDAIDYGHSNTMTPYGRLADLIEPSCDRDTPQKVAEEMFGKMRHSTREEADAYDAMLKSKSVEIHPVDRDALLALAEELDGLGLNGFSSGWSSGAVNVGSFARRIRKALGVHNG